MGDRNERRSNWKNGHTMITITIWQFKKAFCALCHGSIKKKVTLPFCTIGLHLTPQITYTLYKYKYNNIIIIIIIIYMYK